MTIRIAVTGCSVSEESYMHNTNHIHSGLFNQSQRRTNTPPSQLAFVIPGNFPLPQLAHFDILYKDWGRLQNDANRLHSFFYELFTVVFTIVYLDYHYQGFVNYICTTNVNIFVVMVRRKTSEKMLNQQICSYRLHTAKMQPFIYFYLK